MADQVEQILREADRPVQPRDEFRDRLLGELLASLQATRVERSARRRFPLVRDLAVAAMLLVFVAALVIGFRGLRAARLLAPVGPAPIVSISPSKMVSPTTGWAFTGDRLVRTTDGGVQWVDVSPPSLPDRVPVDTSAYFLDARHAWITETTGGSGFSLVSFRTSDGGRTWQQGARVGAPGAGGDGVSPQLYFIDALHGWLLLRGESTAGQPSPTLYSSSDGGLRWTLTSSNPGSPLGCTAWQMAFASASTGWLTTTCPSTQVEPSLLMTQDGGITWHVQPLPLTTSKVICPCSLDPPVFFNHARGILVVHGSPGALLVTSDGGSSWTARSLPGDDQMEVDFADADHGWAIAGPSAQLVKNPFSLTEPAVALPLYHTADGGVTWVPVRTDLLLQSQDGRIDSLSFVDQKNGFASRVTSLGPSQLLKTTDGGITWTVVRPR